MQGEKTDIYNTLLISNNRISRHCCGDKLMQLQLNKDFICRRTPEYPEKTYKVTTPAQPPRSSILCRIAVHHYSTVATLDGSTHVVE